MTECDNAEIRDVLPDYVAETLNAADMSRVAAHIAECFACTEEVALLRVARAARPQAVHIDVDAIVARLVKPGTTATELRPGTPTFVAPVDAAASRVVELPTVVKRPLRARNNVWQFAAALAVVALGGLSVVVARSGGSGMLGVAPLDSTRLNDVAGGAVAPSPLNSALGTPSAAQPKLFADSLAMLATAERVPAKGSTQAVVSVGDLSQYTDAELQKMLDRLDKWDGATSSEVMPTMPIVPVAGAKQ